MQMEIRLPLLYETLLKRKDLLVSEKLSMWLKGNPTLTLTVVLSLDRGHVRPAGCLKVKDST